MADSIDIQVDSYRGKCNLQGASNINGLSWLTSLFKHLDSLGAVNSCTLKTNSPLLANCFRAEVNINNLKWKKITSVDCSVENPNPFPGYVEELKSLTTGICIKEMEIKIHFGNEEVREVWNELSSQILPELYSETLRIKFVKQVLNFYSF